MAELNAKELAHLATTLLAQVKKQEHDNESCVAAIKEKADKLFNTAMNVGNSHSGSNFGYHGALYYRDFEDPPMPFNVEWGGIHGIPVGWKKRQPEEVKLRIESVASLDYETVAEAVKQPLDSAKRLLREILIQLSPLSQLPDGNREKQLLEKMEHFDWKDTAQHDYSVSAVRMFPRMTRDSAAISQGSMLPAHTYYEAAAKQVEKSCEAIEEFWSASDRLLRQLQLASTSKLVTQNEQVDTPNIALRYERLKFGGLLLLALMSSVVIVGGAEYVLRKWRWEWLLSHPNSYSIQLLSSGALLLFFVGLFIRQFRKYWVLALIPLIVALFQVLGGPPHPP